MMKNIFCHKSTLIGAIILSLLLCFLSSILFIDRVEAAASDMDNFCIAPPFVTQSSPPLVMLALGRDHKLYYEAYNDAYDINEDGQIEIGYNHSIIYYGYFDPNRCYTYTSSGTAHYAPVTTYVATDKFCDGSAGHWSGNVLNYLTMSKMDVIRKAFYGGHRTTVSSKVLERAYIPQDAHSWGKEFTGRLCYDGTSAYTNQCMTNGDCASGYTCANKSVQLIGMAGPTTPQTCTPPGSYSWRNNQILAVTYKHNASKTCSSYATLSGSYEPDRYVSHNYIGDFNNSIVAPTSNHDDHYNFLVVADFQADMTGNWHFAVDANDAGEVEIFNVDAGGVATGSLGGVIASKSGTNCGNRCNCQTYDSGNISLTAGNWYRLVARHFEQTGNNDGIRVWYDKPTPGLNWVIFGNAALTIRSFDITPGNECGLMAPIGTPSFVESGNPATSSYTYGSANHHLFCNTTLSDGGAPLLRLLTDRTERVWLWASKERPVCNSPGTSGYPFGSTVPTDYQVRVEVCTDNEATPSATQTDYFKSYCKYYPGGSGQYMPAGLLQKYGEGDGTKVCSKSFMKTCNTNSDCSPASTYGNCVDRTKMMFGMISGSYMKNLSGGVIRKNVWSMLDEIESNNGSFQNSSNVSGDIIDTMEKLKIVGFRYGTDYDYQGTYSGTCGWITDHALNEGECRDWGNPIGEMLFEANRYFANQGTETDDFFYTDIYDANIHLKKMGDGPAAKGPWTKPYELFPACSRPFVLTFSDVNPSYDSDQLPGVSSDFGSGLAVGGLTGLNVSTLADTIGSYEGVCSNDPNKFCSQNSHCSPGTCNFIAGNSRFVGQSGTTNDTLCTAKSVSNLSSVRGICPEEPTKKGSFYSAAMAYYGKEKLKICNNNISTVCTTDSDCGTGKCVKENLTTYSIALSSPVPDVNLKIAGKSIRFIPTGKSVDGCLGVSTNCASNCTFTRDADGVHISSCTANAFCPTNQIVDFYVDSITYDTSNNITYAKFRINFEDVEQGADHDMDAIVTYEIEPDPDDPTNKVIVSLSSDYASGCIDQALGFIITGTTEDGVYLPVKDADSTYTAGAANVHGLPLTWTKTFTVSGNSVNALKDPLWYAAKWGGFEDSDGDGKPYTDNTCGTSAPNSKCSEWDKDGNGIPDTYFLVVNPLKMEKKIEEAFISILRRASSGTAASVLATGQGSGASLVQALFYPKKQFEAANTELDWIGTLQSYWFYIDPYLNNSNLREDTNGDSKLILDEDKPISFYFDDADQKTYANIYSDSGGDGAIDDPDSFVKVTMENLKNLWEAGRQLWNTNPSDRIIYTPCSINSSECLTTTGLMNFSTTNFGTSTQWSYLQAADATEKDTIINYIKGIDSSTMRSRTTGVDLNSDNDVSDTINGVSEAPKVWKLGDIVNSTPTLVTKTILNDYSDRYDDVTYSSFSNSGLYKKKRGTVFVGANDGMLHAFRLGLFENIERTSFHKATLCYDQNQNGKCDISPDETASNADYLGKEQWAFIPKNALPYLKYFGDKNYCHLYYVDLTPFVFDASIGMDTLAANDPINCVETTDADHSKGYWQCRKTANTWRTILIGGMRLGGACKDASDTYGVQVPTAGKGYSSYFALDITDPSAPQLLWEFSNENIPAAELLTGGLGFSTSGPAIVKINARVASGVGGSIGDKSRNGRWFVVLASGPTGYIEKGTRQFMGYSNQPLKLFVLDLKTGELLRTINTSVDPDTGSDLSFDNGTWNAFSGALTYGSVDLDTDYQDDVLYAGYTKSEDATPSASTRWTNGGVIRLITREDLAGTDLKSSNTNEGDTALNPYNWSWSSLAKNVGTVTSAVAHLGHYTPEFMQNLYPDYAYLYFGTGRYFYRSTTYLDDSSSQRTLFGVQEPCLLKMKNINDLSDPICTATATQCGTLSTGDMATDGRDVMSGDFSCLDDATAGAVPQNNDGWFIDLDPVAGTSLAERNIVDPAVSATGQVFFTTFAPTQDICDYGGQSYLWMLDYKTGGSPLIGLRGLALLQLSTGAIYGLSLGSSSFNLSVDSTTGLGRKQSGGKGTPGGKPAITKSPLPLKDIMSIRKR